MYQVWVFSLIASFSLEGPENIPRLGNLAGEDLFEFLPFISLMIQCYNKGARTVSQFKVQGKGFNKVFCHTHIFRLYLIHVLKSLGAHNPRFRMNKTITLYMAHEFVVR